MASLPQAAGVHFNRPEDAMARHKSTAKVEALAAEQRRKAMIPQPALTPQQQQQAMPPPPVIRSPSRGMVVGVIKKNEEVTEEITSRHLAVLEESVGTPPPKGSRKRPSAIAAAAAADSEDDASDSESISSGTTSEQDEADDGYGGVDDEEVEEDGEGEEEGEEEEEAEESEEEDSGPKTAEFDEVMQETPDQKGFTCLVCTLCSTVPAEQLAGIDCKDTSALKRLRRSTRSAIFTAMSSAVRHLSTDHPNYVIERPGRKRKAAAAKPAAKPSAKPQQQQQTKAKSKTKQPDAKRHRSSIASAAAPASPRRNIPTVSGHVYSQKQVDDMKDRVIKALKQNPANRGKIPFQPINTLAEMERNVVMLAELGFLGDLYALGMDRVDVAQAQADVANRVNRDNRSCYLVNYCAIPEDEDEDLWDEGF